MSIKRITNPVEFDKVIDDLHPLFLEEDKVGGHQLLSHSPECIKKAFAHTSILTWDIFVWANKTGETFDAVIIFQNDKNVKFGEKIFHEFLWISRNSNAGYKLFKTAVKFARENGFKTMVMGTVVKNPKHEKIKSFYEKMGFLKDSEAYICKL